MSSETRKLPTTNKTRKAALDTGQAKNKAMGKKSFLTPTTALLLKNIQALYYAAMLAVSNAKAVFFNTTITKDNNMADLEMVCSHFIQVFVFGVKRGVFSVADLAYYNLTLDGVLPDMSTEAKLLAVAAQLIDGDTARMLVPGAVAMAMPAITDVSDAMGDLTDSGTDQNTAKEVLMSAQSDCNALNTQADQCIKLLWGEVETSNVNEPRPTLRANSRLWGVIYEKVGGTKIITGTVTDSETGNAIIDATISFANGNNEADSTAEGFKLDTTLMEVQNLISEHPLYTTVNTTVTLVEGENQVVNIVMKAK